MVERGKANVSFSVFANEPVSRREKQTETRTGVVSGDQVAEEGREGQSRAGKGAQVAQHGGEIGEANDWCRLHGLALQPVFRSTTLVCGYLRVLRPLLTTPWKRCIYISIRSSFDPVYVHPKDRH